VLTITSDFIPSIVIVGFIINGIAITDKFCDKGFSGILKAMIFIYSAFIMKAIIHTILIYANTQNSEASKISMTTMDFILNL
jgi:hypothetical protein